MSSETLNLGHDTYVCVLMPAKIPCSWCAVSLAVDPSTFRRLPTRITPRTTSCTRNSFLVARGLISSPPKSGSAFLLEVTGSHVDVDVTNIEVILDHTCRILCMIPGVALVSSSRTHTSHRHVNMS